MTCDRKETHKEGNENSNFVTLSAESSLILGENKAAYRREGHVTV